ncbi:MAG TPA: diguanylate cyclase [Solirubrobacterales bacterium]
MESPGTSALAHIASRRLRNFSEATDVVLEALSEVIPGVLVLTRVEPDHRSQRVIEVRGEGLEGLGRGATIPAVAGGIDTEFLRSLDARSWVSASLEMSDGRTVGWLFAADRGEGAYGDDHTALLNVGARLLGYEWESVELRSELRRLRGRANAGPRTDGDTGLPNREAFLELLNREWRLTERGTVKSVLVVCRVGNGADEGEKGLDARGTLAVKQVAEVLEATCRGTDHVGRIDPIAVGAILVGCELKDTPAFVSRFRGALQRVTEGSRPEIEVACGVQALAGASSAEEVLGLAETAAHDPGRLRERELASEGLE